MVALAHREHSPLTHHRERFSRIPTTLDVLVCHCYSLDFLFFFFVTSSFFHSRHKTMGRKRGFCQSEEAITSINEVSLSAFIRGQEVINKYNRGRRITGGVNSAMAIMPVNQQWICVRARAREKQIFEKISSVFFFYSKLYNYKCLTVILTWPISYWRILFKCLAASINLRTLCSLIWLVFFS